MALERIEGQPRAVALLGRALESGRVAHAWAFVGPPGSGRTATALAFAAELLGSDAPGHPDLHVIVPTPPEANPKGARVIRLDAIRELERQAALRPARAARKVFVLDEAERMTGEAPQALLKTLEEPPAATVIVLILRHRRALPATVLSRCQIIRFEPRGDEAARARAAEALELLHDVQAKGADELFRRTERLDRERAEGLVDAFWLHCRDLLVAKAGAPAALVGGAARAAELAGAAEAWTDGELVQAIDLCRRVRASLAHNVTPRLGLEVLLSRLALRVA
ncbi:MAG: AAA family ATPase [Candidatus Rokubacteria bacterium]|nr:AAA family ATPase [Candidatus Rokubacteria bacterium]